jgi:hypothetical protein
MELFVRQMHYMEHVLSTGTVMVINLVVSQENQNSDKIWINPFKSKKQSFATDNV